MILLSFIWLYFEWNLSVIGVTIIDRCYGILRKSSGVSAVWNRIDQNDPTITESPLAQPLPFRELARWRCVAHVITAI